MKKRTMGLWSLLCCFGLTGSLAAATAPTPTHQASKASKKKPGLKVERRPVPETSGGWGSQKQTPRPTPLDESYLHLQEAAQIESKKNAAISKTMKTKHSTVKNSINNVR